MQSKYHLSEPVPGGDVNWEITDSERDVVVMQADKDYPGAEDAVRKYFAFLTNYGKTNCGDSSERGKQDA